MDRTDFVLLRFFVGFKTRIEELQERMEKLKKELKKQRDKESSLLEEKERLKQVQANILRWYQTGKVNKESEFSDFLAFLSPFDLATVVISNNFCPDYLIVSFLS